MLVFVKVIIEIMDPETIIKQIEADATRILNEYLNSGEIDKKRASEIASFIIHSLRPHMSFEEIQQVLQEFDSKFPELMKMHLDIEENIAEEIKRQAISQVDILLKQKNITDADKLLKDALSFEAKMGKKTKPHYKPITLLKLTNERAK